MRIVLFALALGACASVPTAPAPARNPVVQVRAHGAHGEMVRAQSGSGFLVDARGLVVTSRHVVALPGHEPAVVTVVMEPDTPAERRLAAEVVRFDPGGDLALLSIDVDADLPTLALGRRADIQVGRPVRVQGFPGSGAFRETQGRVTAYLPIGKRGMRKPRLECDAAVAKGNSGGPVLAADGAVLGVVVEQDTERGIARAVPVDYLRRRLWQWDVLD